jgi:ariadne-1
MSWNKERLIDKFLENQTPILVAAGVQAKAEASSPGPERTRRNSPQPTASSSSTTTAGGGGRRSTRSGSKILSSFKSTSKTSSATSPITKSPSGLGSSGGEEAFVCPICFDDAPDLQHLSLSCDHLYCTNCWEAYISSKVQDDMEHTIQCMAEGCTIVAPDAFIFEVLGKTNPVRAKFEQLLIRHYVSSNPNLKYCPYPGCTNTVSCPAAASKSALTTTVPTVSCGARGIVVDGAEQVPPEKEKEKAEKEKASGSPSSLAGREHRFCFGCPLETDHRPVICAVARMWIKKCQDDSETANWIKSNTKECSQCQSTIEKNGGCK